MTLPFRRRHHDAEAGHDRARTLMSEGLLVTLTPEEGAWLGRHLDSCAECGRDWKGFRADRKLLRRLRDQPLEPPRDLWARTSAALDREAQRRGVPRGTRAARQERGLGALRALPLGAVAGALVLGVFIGTRVIHTPDTPASAAPGTNSAGLPSPAATGVALPPADPLAIIRETANGSWELVYSDVEEVCPPSNRTCVPRPEGDAQSIEIGDRPSKTALNDGQLVIASDADAGGSGQVLVVSVEKPDASPMPTDVVTEPPSTPTAPPPTGESPGPPSASPDVLPPGAIAIATGVSVVGDVAYSSDGRWVAFSAQPSDESSGPDLYLWEVGAPEATVVTNDHQTYFASWHDGQVIASRVEIPGDPAQPDESPEPGRGNGGGNNDGGNQGGGNQGGNPRGSEAPPSATPAAPGESGQRGASPVEGRPISFLLDPESLERTDLTQPNVWLPVLDPTGRFVVYWSGTLRSDDGRTWALGTGELVLDRWSPEAAPDASTEPTPTDTEPHVGPAGVQTILVSGPKATFEVGFDPTGVRLAIWIGEEIDEEVGRLHLLVLDRDSGAVEKRSPLRGAAALRRFSIDQGRLAWVTPSGQDGQESAVQVLGWRGNNFGEIETEPASDLYLP